MHMTPHVRLESKMVSVEPSCVNRYPTALSSREIPRALLFPMIFCWQIVTAQSQARVSLSTAVTHTATPSPRPGPAGHSDAATPARRCLFSSVIGSLRFSSAHAALPPNVATPKALRLSSLSDHQIRSIIGPRRILCRSLPGLVGG